jgi:hypothetical protein
VRDELAHDDRDADDERWRDHKEGEHAAERMDAGMDEPAGVPVFALVQELIWRLDHKVGDEMLELQNQDSSQHELNGCGHVVRFLVLPSGRGSSSVS